MTVPWVALGPCRVGTDMLRRVFKPPRLIDAVIQCICAGGEISALQHWAVSGGIIERTAV